VNVFVHLVTNAIIVYQELIDASSHESSNQLISGLGRLETVDGLFCNADENNKGLFLIVALDLIVQKII
jgi:hypothetical protein